MLLILPKIWLKVKTMTSELLHHFLLNENILYTYTRIFNYVIIHNLVTEFSVLPSASLPLPLSQNPFTTYKRFLAVRHAMVST